MIQGFEKYTHELTDYERQNILPLVVKGLRNKVGKDNAVSNKHICDALNSSGRFGTHKVTQQTDFKKSRYESRR